MSQLLAEFGQRAVIAAQRRWLRVERNVARLMYPARSGANGFFDRYPAYYASSATGAAPNCLNWRYRALIEANKAIIAGGTVLDLASHDGRWSFAALTLGAKHTLGIEAREHLVDNATAALRNYGVSEDHYLFVIGDVFDEIDRLQSGATDTVFCFGFFYHTLHHMLLLSKIARLRPRHLIIDTQIDLRPVDAIFVRMEDTAGEGNVALAGATRTVVGRPTRGALELMLASFGWTWRYYDWHRAGIRDWDHLEDYQEGWRVSLAVDCRA